MNHGKMKCVNMNTVSHCLDIDEEWEDDPDWLKMQRKTEMDIIDGWISKYYADLSLFK